jgi:hypothetical protein
MEQDAAEFSQNIPPRASDLSPLAYYSPRRRADLRVRVVDGETVVFDRRQGLIHQLNHTAHYIWERCDGTSTIAEIAQQLATAFVVEVQTAADDVATLVEQFQTLELLESQDSGARPAD